MIPWSHESFPKCGNNDEAVPYNQLLENDDNDNWEMGRVMSRDISFDQEEIDLVSHWQASIEDSVSGEFESYQIFQDRIAADNEVYDMQNEFGNIDVMLSGNESLARCADPCTSVSNHHDHHDSESPQNNDNDIDNENDNSHSNGLSCNANENGPCLSCPWNGALFGGDSCVSSLVCTGPVAPTATTTTTTTTMDGNFYRNTGLLLHQANINGFPCVANWNAVHTYSRIPTMTTSSPSFQHNSHTCVSAPCYFDPSIPSTNVAALQLHHAAFDPYLSHTQHPNMLSIPIPSFDLPIVNTRWFPGPPTNHLKLQSLTTYSDPNCACDRDSDSSGGNGSSACCGGGSANESIHINIKTDISANENTNTNTNTSVNVNANGTGYGNVAVDKVVQLKENSKSPTTDTTLKIPTDAILRNTPKIMTSEKRDATRPKVEATRTKDKWATKGEYPCLVCGKIYQYQSNLATHAKIHTDQAYECKFCHK
ncbi:ankyrin repeat-containing protein, partial [Reticulomyxa filosa]